MRVVATAGHVDHGKSTLLRALTGMEPDRWEEERERGLTIDLGFVWCELAPDLTVAFVDVPGHERFVGNMLAGAGAVQVALFVVAATDGWSAQSQEHLDILDLLGVSAAVVAVTKTVPAGAQRAATVATDVETRLHGTTLAGAPVVTVDSVAGHGLDGLREFLVDRLRALSPDLDAGRPRLWVDRVFSVAGAGTVVTGTLTGGTLRVGQDVVVLPAGTSGRIRSLQALGEPIEVAVAGSRVAVSLAGVDRDDIARGDAIVGAWADDRPLPARDIASAWRATRELDVEVRALPGAEIGRRGAWHLHVGSAQTTVDIHPLLHEPARAGAPVHARILLDAPLPLVSGDRFVLREAGRRATLGGGRVLDPDPARRPRGTDARLLRATQLDAVAAADGADERLVALVEAAGGARPADRARSAAGYPVGAVPSGVVELNNHLCLPDAVAGWVDAAVEATSAAGPAGRSRRQLIESVRAAGCPGSLAGGLPDAIAERGDLVRSGSTYVAPQHAGTRDEEQRHRAVELLRSLDSVTPPPLADAARNAGVSHEELNALVQSGAVVVCGDVAFARSAVDRAIDRLRTLPSPFTTSQAREALGTSRRYAIPLLEHLDATGVTVFDGEARRLRSTP